MLSMLPYHVSPLMLMLQTRLDEMMVRAETTPEEKKGLPVWAIILIVVFVLLCLIPICVVVILALLGPVIGNVFSNVVEGI